MAMPLYEYKCNSCGDVFEIIQKFSDEPLSVHEKCGGSVERLMSLSALRFKGSGWYVTDYGKGNNKPKSDGENGAGKTDKGKESTASSDSSAKSDKADKAGKTDSKPTTSTPSASKSEK
jgi:putative FmdB family regulatory protein